MKIFQKYSATIATCFIVCFAKHAVAENFALWDSHFMGYGDWSETTNWYCNSAPLPPPGYPDTNWHAEVFGETVTIASQDVSIISLQLSEYGKVAVTNGHSMTTARSIYTNGKRGQLCVLDGSINVLDSLTNRMECLSYTIGTAGSAGYLDLGSMWGATSGWSEVFGELHGISFDLVKGGFRVDAGRISMFEGCAITNEGQELSFRGDWLNPDGTTRLVLNKWSTNSIKIGGNFGFGGCLLQVALSSNTYPFITVDGDAVVTNASLVIVGGSSLTNIGISCDLLRVPTGHVIATNGVSLGLNFQHGVKCSLAIEQNRSGYDFLVLTANAFLPEVAITNLTDGALFRSGSNIPLCVAATDKDGTIISVEFYNGSALLGSCTNAPYSMTLTNVMGGSYVLKAVAHDNDGNVGESAPINIGVQGRAADGRDVFITGGMILKHDPACAQ